MCKCIRFRLSIHIFLVQPSIVDRVGAPKTYPHPLLQDFPRVEETWKNTGKLPEYLHTYIPTYLHTYIPTYLHTYIPTYLHTYIPTYIPTYLHTYLHTYIPTYLHTYILTYLHTYISTYIHTYIHRYIPRVAWPQELGGLGVNVWLPAQSSRPGDLYYSA